MVTARISAGFRWRRALLAVVLIGWALWSLYDGLIAYPEQRRRAEAYAEIQDRGGNDWVAEWERTAAGNGWPGDNPGTPRSDADVFLQYVFVVLTLPPGLLCAWSFVSSFRRWIGLDGEVLVTHSGKRIAFDAITDLDLRRWERKGIAVVQYEQDGRRGKLVLDDWKYDQAATEAMVAQVRGHLGLAAEPVAASTAEGAADTTDGSDGSAGS